MSAPPGVDLSLKRAIFRPRGGGAARARAKPLSSEKSGLVRPPRCLTASGAAARPAKPHGPKARASRRRRPEKGAAWRRKKLQRAASGPQALGKTGQKFSRGPHWLFRSHLDLTQSDHRRREQWTTTTTAPLQQERNAMPQRHRPARLHRRGQRPALPRRCRPTSRRRKSRRAGPISPTGNCVARASAVPCRSTNSARGSTTSKPTSPATSPASDRRSTPSPLHRRTPTHVPN